jgi:hypothetical protein
MYPLYINRPCMFIVTVLWIRIRNDTSGPQKISCFEGLDFLSGGWRLLLGFKAYDMRSSFRVKRGAGLYPEWFERSDPALK